MAKVEKFIMPLEEFYQKYGFYPPKHPELIDKTKPTKNPKKKKAEKPIKNWNWSKLSKEQYLAFKDQGLLDSEVIEKVEWLTYERLHKLKKRWGMIS